MKMLMILALMMPALGHAATVYRSVGPEGQVIYSDKPPADGKVERTLSFSNLPATPMPESVRKYRDELEKSMQKRLTDAGRFRSSGQAVLFSAKWCGYCTRAKGYLAEKKIPYQEFDIDTADGMRALVEAGGGRSVPVLLWDNQRVQGFSRPAYDALFGALR